MSRLLERMTAKGTLARELRPLREKIRAFKDLFQ